MVLSDTFWRGIESSFLSSDAVIDGFVVTFILSSLFVVVDVILGRPGLFLNGRNMPIGILESAGAGIFWQLDSFLFFLPFPFP